MSIVGQIITIFLILPWVAMPMVALMMFSDNPYMASPSWGLFFSVMAGMLYPIVIGLIYYMKDWKFFFLSPTQFVVAVSILPVLGALMLSYLTVPNLISGKDPRVKIENGLVVARGIAFPDADPETFVLLENPEYAKDKNKVYYAGKIIEGFNPAELKVLYAKDSGISAASYRDNKNVYMRGTRLAGIDPDSFERVNAFYSKDKSHIIASPEFEPIINGDVDIATFVPLNSGSNQTPYAKDKNTVFFHGKKVEGADVSTFKVLNPATGNADAQDKDHSYERGVMLK